jgi:ATPase subunit of ABC transporter with duplicated ATPase domains
LDTLELKLTEKKQGGGSDSSKNKKTKESDEKTITRQSVEALGSHIVNVLDGLGLSKPLKRLSMQLSELSGGWRMRAALAQCLCHLDSIDVLLLDEPTNHCKELLYFPFYMFININVLYF